MGAEIEGAAAIAVLLSLVYLVVAGSPPVMSSSSGAGGKHQTSDHIETVLRRSSFPPGFLFGAASSAYQYEGAVAKDGRGKSIWDTYTHEHPEEIIDGSNGDTADDSYDRYKEDVRIIKAMGMNAYRFSISWTRILPNGKLSGGVNKKGIDHYNKLINLLIANGVQPVVTLFHWDLPQVLEDEYGGFLSQHIVKDFRDYAEICFREFGDRVKHWITLNEPSMYAISGYPSAGTSTSEETHDLQCFLWTKARCYVADIGRSPYVLAHNQLLAHATVVDLYRCKFQIKQKGIIGISLNSNWYLPYDDCKSSKEAVARILDFSFGWFMNPITRGEYPARMRRQVRDRLPKFSKKQIEMLKGSFDFVGINYYTSYYAYSVPPPSSSAAPSYYADKWAAQTPALKNGTLIGPQASGATWEYIYAPGLRDLLKYIKRKYNNPVIYITENGIGLKEEKLEDALKDDERISYHQQHLFYLHKAIRFESCVDVRGYLVWSLLDDFEWNSGYTVRFGFNFVDYANGLKRYPKKSATWLSYFLKKNYF